MQIRSRGARWERVMDSSDLPEISSFPFMDDGSARNVGSLNQKGIDAKRSTGDSSIGA
jgi:hypothetical protein